MTLNEDLIKQIIDSKIDDDNKVTADRNVIVSIK